MNPKERRPFIGGYKIFGMFFVLIGLSLTIICGILLGMFFMYPLGNVIPEDHYIIAYEDEFMFLATLLGFGIFLLILGFTFEAFAIIGEYNISLQTKSNIHKNLSKKYYIDEKKEITLSEEDLETFLVKNNFIFLKTFQ